MELYIHIPFCVRKCNYCDFLSFPGFGSDADEKHHCLSDAYIDSLCREIEVLKNNMIRASYLATDFKTIFIGGGTPSILEPGQTEKLLKAIKSLKDLSNDQGEAFCEYTVECNPGTLCEEKLLLYKEYGVNRLSIGLQSADNDILKRLGRIHSYETFLENYETARKIGFKNINIDLISAVPGQSMENWRETLEKAAGLNPEHISAYSLILEEGTPLYDMYMNDPASLQLPDEDTERRMYHETEEILNKYGYNRYEISNYSKQGFECRHNIGYWTGEEYVGLGLGAASYLSADKLVLLRSDPQKSLDDKEKCMYRIKNAENMEEYLKNHDHSLYNIEEILDKKSRMAEFCILGLRMCKGISVEKYKTIFGEDIYDRFGNVLGKHIRSGLLVKKGDRICFSGKGLDLSNTVLCDFI